jgi:hypothetical protein
LLSGQFVSGQDINGYRRLATGRGAAAAAGIDINAHPVIFDHRITLIGSLLPGKKGRFLTSWKGGRPSSVASIRLEKSVRDGGPP